jgi:signal transduction histidine kinase
MSPLVSSLRSAAVRYAFAIATTGAVTGLCVALRSMIQPRHSPPFLLAVLVVAWFAGFGPAVVTCLLSIVVMNYFFIPPLHSLSLFSAHELIGAPVFAAVALGMAWLATTRRSAEAARVEALAREQAARADAEAANRAKDEFLAVLGHELRNPLAAISSAAHVLETAARHDETVARVREVIGRQARNLGCLVDDLLEVNRVMKGKVMLNRAPTDLSEAVRRCLATLGAAGRLERHLLKLDLSAVWVDADAIRLDQVVTNLLENAVKYTPGDGSIVVSLGAAGAHAVLEISDTGIGIPAALLPRMFDVFVQGDPGSRHSHGGLGIGLTVVRRMIELHGGSVTATSDGPGRGSTFTVRLPRIPAPPAAQTSAAIRSSAD